MKIAALSVMFSTSFGRMARWFSVSLNVKVWCLLKLKAL